MNRARATRETLLLILAAAAGLVALALVVPSRNQVMAPCELLPAKMWELRNTERGWESRIVDYRRGGTVLVESHDLGTPARVTITVPMDSRPGTGSQPSSSVHVRAGQIVARIAPAGVDAQAEAAGMGTLLGMTREITSPIAGRFRLGEGSMCRVEAVDTLVARISVSQQQPLDVRPGDRILVAVEGIGEPVAARMLSIPPVAAAQAGQWEIYAELLAGDTFSPGMRGYARAGWTHDRFPAVLWQRLRAQFQPRLQLPQ